MRCLRRTTLPEARPRRVCVVLVDRANYGRLEPVMEAVRDREELELQVIAAGTMVLERFDHPVEVVKDAGFDVVSEVYFEVEGSNPTTMAKSIGLGLVDFAGEFRRLQPDIVLIIGDRYEALAATIAAAYMNLCIVHVQGGEVSGSIDESARHAISKFAHYHVPSTRRAAAYLERMGERPETILAVGCPSSDLAKRADRSFDPSIVNDRGSGRRIDFSQPYQLVVFHPTTTEFGGETEQMATLLQALERLDRQTIVLWPNIDAGSDDLSRAIRVYRDRHGASWMHTLVNLPPDEYLKVLAGASCAIGNSSSFVRDASYFGTPVVLVGPRQRGRERDRHVTPVPVDADAIVDAVKAHDAVGRYPASTLYGDGEVAPRVAEAIVALEPYLQKRLDYVRRDAEDADA